MYTDHRTSTTRQPHGQGVCPLIDLDVERIYWVQAFATRPSLQALGPLAIYWPLLVVGYSRYLTHIRHGQQAFIDSFHDEASASPTCSAHAADLLLLTLRARLGDLAARFPPG